MTTSQLVFVDFILLGIFLSLLFLFTLGLLAFFILLLLLFLLILGLGLGFVFPVLRLGFTLEKEVIILGDVCSLDEVLIVNH